MKFRTTVLLTILCIVAAILVPVGLVVDRMLEAEARTSLRESLTRSSAVFEELQRSRQSQLATQARVTSEEPRLKAVVATDEVERETILDVALELRGAMGSDLFLMTDGTGSLLADTADPKAAGHDLSGLPLVRQTIAEGQAAGVWSDETSLYQMQGQRIAFGDTVVGTLLVGYRIDDSIAEAAAQLSGSAVAIQVDGRTIASSSGAQPARVDADLTSIASDTVTAQEVTSQAERLMALARPLPGYRGELTVRYVAFRSLDAALAASRRIRGMLFGIGAVGFSLALVLAVAGARKLARPLDQLVALTKRIAAGDSSSRATPSGPTELRALAHSMNAMAEQLAASRAEIDRINAGLEQTVADRTNEIAQMLDNLDEALFIIDDRCIVTGRCSANCEAIFGRSIVDLDVIELLFTNGPESDAEALSMHTFVLRGSVGEQRFQWQLNEDHLLRSVVYVRPDGNARTLELRYAPLFDANARVERIMVIATDVTEVLALKRSIEEQQQHTKERVAVLMELLAGPRALVLGFIDDNAARVERLRCDLDAWTERKDREALTRILRELHTIKGNARMLSLPRISRLTHEVEEFAHADLRSMGERTELRGAIEQLFGVLELFQTVAAETLRGGNAEPDRARADTLCRRLRALATSGTQAALTPDIEAIERLVAAEARDEAFSVEEIFQQHAGLVGDIAERLGKQVELASACETGDLFVSPPVARALRDAMNHAVRNALDHGIETPEARTAAGKAPRGRIWWQWRRTSGAYHIELRDDGQGIDPSLVSTRAHERGLLAADSAVSDEGVFELLFTPGFTTKAVVTDVSGRGVGLDAIRAAVVGFGGDVRIASELGAGATLRITLPASAVSFIEIEGRVESVGAATKAAA